MKSPKVAKNTLLASMAVAAITLFAVDAMAVGFQYKIQNQKSQTDGDPAVLVLQATDFVKKGNITIKSSSGKTFNRGIGRLNPGGQLRVPIKDSLGSHSYTATITAVGTSGAKVTIPLKFKAVRVKPIKLKIDRDSVNTAKGQLTFTSNVGVNKILVEVYNDEGKKIGSEEVSFDNKSGKQTLKWQTTGKVGALKLTAYDEAGFWTSLLLEPWWIEIEHKDIIFDFGKDTWQAAEEQKLVDSLKEIKKQIKKIKRIKRSAKNTPNMRLYIAGYTDTVGSKAENRKLSAARAHAIAKWFKKKGVKMQIYYQGFGEDALAVKTPDNTAEAKNRRAIYVLGNATPPTSQSMPYRKWSRAN